MGLRTVGLWLALSGLLLGGCASLPVDYPRTQTQAFGEPERTAIGAYLAKAATRHPGKSGFAVIRQGRNAFTNRVALTEFAEKTLDVQYYIWEPDDTGRILAERLMRAADRGVRMRVLLEAISYEGRDTIIAGLDAHPVGGLSTSFGERSDPTWR